MLDQESQAIATSRTQGTAREQAAAWGLLANTLLEAYQNHCVGRRRLAVRPHLLRRLQQTMADVVAAMTALRDAGLDAPYHQEVIAHLTEQAQAWQQEYNDTVQARAQVAADVISQAISDELDDVLQTYNDLCGAPEGLNRAALGPLCDRLDELHQQLVSEPTQVATMVVAADALAMLCCQFDELPKAAAP